MPQDKTMPRMTEQEYLYRLEHLQTIIAEGMVAGESAEVLNARYAAMEFDLTIDYRLGQNFSQELRRMLYSIRECFNHEKANLVQQFTRSRVGEEAFRQQLQMLVDAMAAKYAEVLTPQEYREFIGSETDIIDISRLLG